jgi:hypothetical protein
MILLAAQGMPTPRIAEVTFTSQDRVRDVTHNFNTDGLTRCTRATEAAGRLRSRRRSASRSRSWRSAVRRTTTCRFRPGA